LAAANDRRPVRSTLFPYTTLFRSTPGSAISTADACALGAAPNAVDAPEKIFDAVDSWACVSSPITTSQVIVPPRAPRLLARAHADRKSTRLNSSHQIISYAVFCLK